MPVSRRPLKALLRRPIREDELPVIVYRKRWIDFFGLFTLLALAAIAVLSVWLALTIGPAADLWSRSLLLLFASLLVIWLWHGVDMIFGYRLIIDQTGVELSGRLSSPLLEWDEITEIGTWKNRTYAEGMVIPLPGWVARIYVDGSRNPARLARNFFLRGYFTPTYMELDGRDIAKLLLRAKRQFHGAE